MGLSFGTLDHHQNSVHRRMIYVMWTRSSIRCNKSLIDDLRDCHVYMPLVYCTVTLNKMYTSDVLGVKKERKGHARRNKP